MHCVWHSIPLVVEYIFTLYHFGLLIWRAGYKLVVQVQCVQLKSYASFCRILSHWTIMPCTDLLVLLAWGSSLVVIRPRVYYRGPPHTLLNITYPHARD